MRTTGGGGGGGGGGPSVAAIRSTPQVGAVSGGGDGGDDDSGDDDDDDHWRSGCSTALSDHFVEFDLHNGGGGGGGGGGARGGCVGQLSSSGHSNSSSGHQLSSQGSFVMAGGSFAHLLEAPDPLESFKQAVRVSARCVWRGVGSRQGECKMYVWGGVGSRQGECKMCGEVWGAVRVSRVSDRSGESESNNFIC